MIMQPALSDNLLEQVLASDNVAAAWKRVKANGGTAGVDGMSCEKFLRWSYRHWVSTRESLENGSYRPQPVLRVEIPKRSGGTRPLGIPTVCDRVIEQAILQVLTPIFDPEFSESSFGFRPRRSAHGAIRQVRALAEAGYRWIVDIDISKFFDTVDHDILMNRVARQVSDKRVLKLIGRYLRAGVKTKGAVEPTMKGTPQGGPLSPLLANIYLDILDRELEKRHLNFVRYADDLLILVKSKAAAWRVMASVTRFIEKRLKLSVNREKSAVRRIDDTEYLGFLFKGRRKLKLRWADRPFADFKWNIKRITSRKWRVSMPVRLQKLSRYVRGWMQYYGISQYYSPFQHLDEWIRRRVRMCYLKQWRYKRTRIAKLIGLGVTPAKAKRFAYIPGNWWYLSKLYAVNWGMSNTWLNKQGLINVKDLWVKIHYPNTPRLSFAS